MQSVKSGIENSAEWIKIGFVNEIPKLGARIVRTAEVDIAIFRTSEDKIFAIRDECPHKQGPLSQGIVHGEKVSCPLHDWKINLQTGQAVAPDEGCTATYPIKQDGDIIYLSLKHNIGCPNK